MSFATAFLYVCIIASLAIIGYTFTYGLKSE